ncbi:MAG: hypothetical protein NTW49_06095 [Bacteroidia bacterium]|nr:hypothetical protein [Bacteroidia bacterium]
MILFKYLSDEIIAYHFFKPFMHEKMYDNAGNKIKSSYNEESHICFAKNFTEPKRQAQIEKEHES